MRTLAPALAIAAAFALCLAAHAAAALGAHTPNFFDGALFLLQPLYAAQGLTPYRDYAFLYPPGAALLFGEWLGLSTPEAVRAVHWSLVLALALAQAALFARQSRAAAALSLLLSAAIALFWGEMGVEALTPHLAALLLLVLLQPAPPVRLAGIAALAAAAMLFRWDRPLATGLVLAALAFAWPRALAAPALAVLAGCALGAAAILLHAWHHSAVAQAWEAIVAIPFATLPFRRLPIPWTANPLAYEFQFLAAPAALALLAIAAWRHRAAPPAQPTPPAYRVLLPVLPLALLPYATGRADAPHALPLSLLAATAAIAALAAWPARRLAAAALLLAILPLAPQALRIATTLGPPGHADRTAAGWTAGCTPLFPAEARALLVGQASYASYLTNIPLFHLARPDLRPAGRFLSDEPGLQSACRWGADIATHLAAAPRPLLALLDTAPQPAEPNATATMQSCGAIETALAAMPHRVLGHCPFAGRKLELRQYD